MKDHITGIVAKVERQQFDARRKERLDIAKHAMQGLLAHGLGSDYSYSEIARMSAKNADALIAELDKTDD